MFEVISREFTNQFRPETTNYQLSIVGNYLVAVHEVDIFWKAEASEYLDPFTVDLTNKKITRQSGSFVNDGFNLGDDIVIYDDGGAKLYTTTISQIEDSYIVYASGSGTEPDTGVNIDLKVFGITDLVENTDYTLTGSDFTGATFFISAVDFVVDNYPTVF